MFAYPDAARYRLGVNYQQLPCNRPISQVYSPYQRDGAFRYDGNYGGQPNYVRSSFQPMQFLGQVGANGATCHEEWVGKVSAFTSEVTDEDFVQAAALWEVFGKDGVQDNFVYNVCQHLRGAAPHVQKETFGELSSLRESLFCFFFLLFCFLRSRNNMKSLLTKNCNLLPSKARAWKPN